MPFSRSRSPESITRSTTASLARKTPVWRSIASTSVVLPWSTWATMARLRRSSRTAEPAAGACGLGRGARHGECDCRTRTASARYDARYDRCCRDPVRADPRAPLADAAGRPAARRSSSRRGPAARRRSWSSRSTRSGGRCGRARRIAGSAGRAGAGRDGPGRPDRARHAPSRPSRSRRPRPPDLAGPHGVGRRRDGHVADRGTRRASRLRPAAALRGRAWLAGAGADVRLPTLARSAAN